jgi:hypothetical protein
MQIPPNKANFIYLGNKVLIWLWSKIYTILLNLQKTCNFTFETMFSSSETYISNEPWLMDDQRSKNNIVSSSNESRFHPQFPNHYNLLGCQTLEWNSLHINLVNSVGRNISDFIFISFFLFHD